MNKVISILLCSIIMAFAMNVHAQEASAVPATTQASTSTTAGLTLPTFKTFYRTQYVKEDISLESKGGMVGHIKVEGRKCFVDEEVVASFEDGKFIVVAIWKPRHVNDTNFCGNRKVTIQIPPKGGLGRLIGENSTAVFHF